MGMIDAIAIVLGERPTVVGYTGSRYYRRPDLVRGLVARQAASGWLVCVASGDDPEDPTVRTSVVDHAAIYEARRLGMPTLVFVPDWPAFGRAAGPRRNEVLVAECDAVVGFWDGRSRGTADTILAAFAAGKLRRVYDAAGNPLEPDVAAARADAVYSRNLEPEYA